MNFDNGSVKERKSQDERCEFDERWKDMLMFVFVFVLVLWVERLMTVNA